MLKLNQKKQKVEYMRKIMIKLIKLYQKSKDPNAAPKCKYSPSCSNYSIDAYKNNNFFKATLLMIWRILRCNPFSKGGYDPAPKRKIKYKKCREEKITNFIENSNKIFDTSEYITRSMYVDIEREFKDTYETIKSHIDNRDLKRYAKYTKTSKRTLFFVFEKYKNLTDAVEEHNKNYLHTEIKSNEKYLDNILNEIDPDINLDENQRQVVLNDQDNLLVIAGAGAGKTTTIAAKVKYLVDIKKVKPSEILIVSYTNKAVNELKERINDNLNIEADIRTFHKVGNDIIKKKPENANLKVVPQHYAREYIKSYLDTYFKNNQENLRKLLLFFGIYFDIDKRNHEINRHFASDLETLKSKLKEYNLKVTDTKKTGKITITDEVLKSQEEVEIANYLYRNNIEYIYEKEYPHYLENSSRPYMPDFYIKQGDKEAYIEHFGINEDLTSSRYNNVELDKYVKSMNNKIALHKKQNTLLLKTFSRHNNGKHFLDNLKEQLLKNGFTFSPKTEKEIYDKLVACDNKYMEKFVDLVFKYINQFKINGYEYDKFKEFMNNTNSIRTKIFIEITSAVYLEYTRVLKEGHYIDFEDMINEANKILEEDDTLKFDYKYVFIDEYQDISQQRFNLTKTFSKKYHSKIIAVGDDWQSIYAFAGSNLDLFMNFQESVGNADEMYIYKTYRNSQELINIAGEFIQKNSRQKRKALISDKSIKTPLTIYGYTCGENGKIEEKAKIIDSILQQIEKDMKSKGKKRSSVLLLGRFGFDAHKLRTTKYFTYVNKTIKSKANFNIDIEFLTAHSSKGLGYDNVIIINGDRGTYGFPSEKETDPVLKTVIKTDNSISDAEERRLFYVALTRTKNKVYIVADSNKPSKFIVELLTDKKYKNIKVIGNINKHIPEKNEYICPNCGDKMQLKFHTTYGLELYICTNDDEVCGFVTNNLSGGNTPIRKCPKCINGYLIVKYRKDTDSHLWGCTDFEEIECGHIENIKK